jgi:hypothetical protein
VIGAFCDRLRFSVWRVRLRFSLVAWQTVEQGWLLLECRRAMGLSRGAPTTAGSQLSEGDFSYDVHPFRFPSATGITPKLVVGRAAGGTPRERQPLGLFSKNTALSSFGGKFGDSTQWLTPRGEVGGKSLLKDVVWVSSMCARGSRTLLC